MFTMTKEYKAYRQGRLDELCDAAESAGSLKKVIECARDLAEDAGQLCFDGQRRMARDFIQAVEDIMDRLRFDPRVTLAGVKAKE